MILLHLKQRITQATKEGKANICSGAVKGIVGFIGKRNEVTVLRAKLVA